MDRRAEVVRPYRQTVVLSAGALAVAAVAALAVHLVTPMANLLTRSLGEIALPVGLLGLLFLVLAVGTASVRAVFPPIVVGPAIEEPLVTAPRLPAIRKESPLILVLGIAPKAGATTLAATLAVLIASEGRSRRDPSQRPRPACIWDRLEEADRDLSVASLAAYLAVHPTMVRDDVVDIATRHPSGAEFLGVSERGMHAEQFQQLLPVLRRHYELIVYDAPVSDRQAVDTAVELADAIVLVAPDRDDGVGAAFRWAERVLAVRPTGKTILAVSRRRAPYPLLSQSPFPYLLELPEATTVGDEIGVTTWPLTSSAAGQLRTAVQMMLPQLFPGEST